jgi:PAS domain-containing protein
MDDTRDRPDFKRIFESLPGCYLILLPDPPNFTIVAVSDAYAAATGTDRASILGKGVFQIFPDNPGDPQADGVMKLTASLMRVLERKTIDFMSIQKYDIPDRRNGGGAFEGRYWSPDNSPVLDEEGRVAYIVHHVTDVTGQEKLLRMYGGAEADVADPFVHLTQDMRLEKIMVGREKRMLELKDRIRVLEGRLGAH